MSKYWRLSLAGHRSFESTDLPKESDTFLTLTVSSQDDDGNEYCCGILEGYTIGLIIQLEQLDIFVRPWTGIQKRQNTAHVVLGLNLPPDCDHTTVEQLGKDFVLQFNCGIVVNSAVKIVLNLS